jgi:hypothetical protein
LHFSGSRPQHRNISNAVGGQELQGVAEKRTVHQVVEERRALCLGKD